MWTGLLKAWKRIPFRTPRRRRGFCVGSAPAFVEVLESRTLLSSAGLMADDLVVVPGESGQTVDVRFDWTERNAAYRSEIGVFVVQSDQGRVGGFAPGDPGYAAAVLSSHDRHVLFARGEGPGATRQLTFTAGDRLGFYLIPNATSRDVLEDNPENRPSRRSHVFFSTTAANPDGFDHLRSEQLSENVRRFAWEDLLFGGDRDFDDVIVTMTTTADVGTDTVCPAAALPSPGQMGQTVSATVTLVQRDAAFENEMGVFPVDDAEGRIGSLLPGEAGYAQTALAQPGRQTIFSGNDLIGTAQTLELPGGRFFGMYLIQDGTVAEFLVDNATNALAASPQAFFSFPAANPDGIDHVRETTDHQFAWEDLTHGGDRDFNDLVAAFTFGTPTGTGTDNGGQTMPPDQPDLAAESDTGSSQSDNVTNDTTATIHVIAPAGTTVTLLVDGETVGTQPSDGTAEFTINELDDGTYQFTAIVEDACGHVSLPSDTLEVVVDTTSPDITLELDPETDTPPVGDDETREPQVTLQGQTEPNLPVTLESTGMSTTADADGNFEFEGVDLAPGPNALTVTVADLAGNMGSTTLTVTRVDDNVSITIDDVLLDPEGDEGTTNAVFTVMLTAPSSQTVTVDFTTLEGSATADEDFEPTSGTLTFAPGETIQTVVVPVVGDDLEELAEEFFVELSNATNADIERRTGTGLILDDDEPAE